MNEIALKWLRWRYGGNVYALKPPIGYSRYLPRPLTYKVAYHVKHTIWRIENVLFQRFGQPMRDAWKRSMAL